MAVREAALATICKAVADIVDESVFADETASVTIGAPGENTSNANRNRLNLFFYRFEPYDFNASAGSHDVLFLRTHCMITAFGVADAQTETSAGENELRMLSHVMRLFHENPVWLLPEEELNQWQTQMVLKSVGEDQVNQIWSTQGDLVFRPSVFYELSLMPVEPEVPAEQAPLVGRLGTMAVSDIEDRYSGYPVETRGFRVPVVKTINVPINNPNWSPVICLVSDSECHYTLSIDVSAGFGSVVPPDLWIAGEAGDTESDYVLVGSLLQKNDAESPPLWTDYKFTNIKRH